MNRSKYILLFSLVTLLVPATLVLAATPEREVVWVESLSGSVVFDELTAAPGETVRREIRVPVRFHYSDGTSEEGYEVARFALTNETMPSGATYVLCSGSLNQVGRHLTSQIGWQWDNVLVANINTQITCFQADWPYYAWYSRVEDSAGAPGWARATGFFQPKIGAVSWRVHDIHWTLPHDSSNCTAQGFITS